MTDPQPEKPRRRPRYSGKNPRRFEEKYKEHAPERYAADVAKVLASGKTPAGMHRPIMVREILEVLAPRHGEIAVDCTLGYGGHAQEILSAIIPGGRLLGLDADPRELPKTEARLRALGFPPETLAVHRMNFAGLAQLLSREAPDGADVILADLGVSSMQIDNPARGFTFKAEGPLDLRMNPDRGQPASALLATITAPKLERLLTENADEPHAPLLTSALLLAQQRSPITTTTALAAVIREALAAVPRYEPDDSVRRVFQALRIAVNDEFAALDTFLRHLPRCLRPGGRVAILTFHSGEDRRVKQSFKVGARDGLYAEVAREVLRPSPEELRANPRSASAKLRWARRSEIAV
jgi:16S rRNA (cytosine1402-N4)-methyltransferase